MFTGEWTAGSHNMIIVIQSVGADTETASWAVTEASGIIERAFRLRKQKRDRATITFSDERRTGSGGAGMTAHAVALEVTKQPGLKRLEPARRA